MPGEFELIQNIRRSCRVPQGMTGIGDDCAILPQSSGVDTLVSTDMLMEGVHFLIDKVSPRQLGWKSAAVNISDIAAMGGEPVGSTLAFALPANLPDGWVDGFMDGYLDVSNRFGCALMGGDTTSSPDRLCISVTVLGKCPGGSAVRRNGAVKGDLICVTGELGTSAAGLEAILRHIDEQSLTERHYCPLPRVHEGITLRQSGIHAMMDISDGVASDIRHIMEESGVGAVISTGSLPIAGQVRKFCLGNGIDPVRLALCGGEDYELLFTASPETVAALDIEHHIIGRITGGSRLVWEGAGSEDYQGFRHF